MFSNFSGNPCVLAAFFFSPLVSYGVMAILFPLVSLSLSLSLSHFPSNIFDFSHFLLTPFFTFGAYVLAPCLVLSLRGKEKKSEGNKVEIIFVHTSLLFSSLFCFYFYLLVYLLIFYHLLFKIK